MWFLRNRSSYSFEIVPLWLAPENFRVHWVWPSKYKGKWCFSPKCGFSETDHHTALKFVPLWLAHLKMSACTEFGPLNTKESNVLAQNVVSQKQIIIQLWNLVPLWLTPENFRVHWVWPSKYKGKWCFSLKMWFLWNRSSYSFEICTIVIDTPENVQGALSLAL